MNLILVCLPRKVISRMRGSASWERDCRGWEAGPPTDMVTRLGPSFISALPLPRIWASALAASKVKVIPSCGSWGMSSSASTTASLTGSTTAWGWPRPSDGTAEHGPGMRAPNTHAHAHTHTHLHTYRSGFQVHISINTISLQSVASVGSKPCAAMGVGTWHHVVSGSTGTTWVGESWGHCCWAETFTKDLATSSLGQVKARRVLPLRSSTLDLSGEMVQ